MDLGLGRSGIVLHRGLLWRGNHVVVTRRGDSYTMWINGDRVGRERSPDDISDTDNTNPFIVGGFTYESGVRQMFQGSLDEFRIFRRCLPDEEIVALYEKGAKRIHDTVPGDEALRKAQDEREHRTDRGK